MTLSALQSRAQQGGTVQVGASALYPVLSIAEREEVTGPAGANGRPVLRRTISIQSWAFATGESPAAVGALKNTISAALNRRGDSVSIIERGGTARVLRAGGDVSGLGTGGTTTRIGFPVCRVEFGADRSGGAVRFFTLTIDTEEITFASSVVMHQFGTTFEEDAGGNIKTTVRGSVRLKPGQDAAAWIETNVLDDARDDAATAGLRFTSRRTLNDLDTSAADYEWSSAAEQYGGGEVVTGATIIDETDTLRSMREGRSERVVAGTVKGTGAYAAAVGRSPTLAAGQVLTSTRISQPNSLTGQVSYEYNVAIGRVPTELPGTYVFSFRQSISEPGGGRTSSFGAYDNAAPVVWYGPVQPYTVTETTDLEFTGTEPVLDDIPAAYTAANHSARPVVERAATAPGLRSLRFTRTYIFETEPTPAAPAELTFT